MTITEWRRVGYVIAALQVLAIFVLLVVRVLA